MATYAVDYLRQVMQDLSLDTEETGTDSASQRTYAKMVAAQAGLLSDHSTAEAEEAYRIAMNIWPYNPEVVFNFTACWPFKIFGRTLSQWPRPPSARPQKTFGSRPCGPNSDRRKKASDLASKGRSCVSVLLFCFRQCSKIFTRRTAY
jgi:hypothetical protein